MLNLFSPIAYRPGELATLSVCRATGCKGEQWRGTEETYIEPFELLRGGASGDPKESVPIIAVLELTSLDPLLPDANSSSLRRKQARRAARRQQRLSDLTRRGPPLREVSAVGRVVTVDRHDAAGHDRRVQRHGAQGQEHRRGPHAHARGEVQVALPLVPGAAPFSELVRLRR